MAAHTIPGYSWIVFSWLSCHLTSNLRARVTITDKIPQRKKVVQWPTWTSAMPIYLIQERNNITAKKTIQKRNRQRKNTLRKAWQKFPSANQIVKRKNTLRKAWQKFPSANQIVKPLDKPQWIVAQWPLSTHTIPGYAWIVFSWLSCHLTSNLRECQYPSLGTWRNRQKE